MTTAERTKPETEQPERYVGKETTEGTVEEILANLTNGTSSAPAEKRDDNG